MDKLIKVLQTNSQKTRIGLFLLLCGLLISAYIFIGQKLENYFATTPAIPQLQKNYTCPFNYKMYSVAAAAKNPESVCGISINEARSFKGLASISTSLIHIDQIVIQDLDDAEIPPQIGNLQSMQSMTIADTDGEIVVPPEIGYLKNLSHLIISHNNEMTSLPVSVAQLTNMTTLVIRYNPKLTIPDSLVGLPKLISLVVIGQKVKIIPAKVYRLTNLQTLNYSNNQIETVSSDINTLYFLNQINFNGNKLKIFPAVDKLVHLTLIDLSQNKLTKLPYGYEYAKQLETLHVSDNQLDDDTVKNIQQLTQLVSLDLGNNKLVKIPPGLTHLKKLQYLRLSGNSINPADVVLLKQHMPHTTIVY